jgi:membrane fusion protein (multidrug efflux system)
MKKRMFLVVTAMVLFIAAIGSFKFFQIKEAMAQGASFQPPPEAVTTVVTASEDWPTSLESIGSVVAVQGVTVSADLPGIVERIAFESGETVRKGELLVELDTSQERAQLAAAESAQKLARLNLERMVGLRQKGVTSQAELDRLQAEFDQSAARVGEIRATIGRKRILAPFPGVLGLRQVNLGQYLNGGDAVASLQTLDPIFVDFAVPQQDVGRLRQLSGDRLVEVTTDGQEAAAFAGKITAIDSVVDEATRNVRVRASFANTDHRLQPGMFVKAKIAVGSASGVISLPTSAINYAPYGDTVYVVGPISGPNGASYTGVRQQVVKLGASRGDQVAILSGLTAGEEVVTSGVFKLRPGAAVEVNNQVQPANDAAPKPEDS